MKRRGRGGEGDGEKDVRKEGDVLVLSLFVNLCVKGS